MGRKQKKKKDQPKQPSKQKAGGGVGGATGILPTGKTKRPGRKQITSYRLNPLGKALAGGLVASNGASKKRRGIQNQEPLIEGAEKIIQGKKKKPTSDKKPKHPHKPHKNPPKGNIAADTEGEKDVSGKPGREFLAKHRK